MLPKQRLKLKRRPPIPNKLQLKRNSLLNKPLQLIRLSKQLQRMLKLNKKLRLLLTLRLLNSNRFKLSFLQTIRLIRSFPENLFGRSHKLTV